jgi:replication-associated recombination protein RarA
VHKYKIEDRRKRVASLLAQSMTETEIAKQLCVNQSTISRDIKVLKQLSQKFVYDLAKSDLAFSRPRYFIIDELEKMNRKDQTSFLNLMESGILSELKHNQQRSTQLKTWVWASCNSTDKLLPPLLSRFRAIHFKPYTEQEFVQIVVNVLDREEGVDRDIALLIADGVYNRLKSSNIRECVRIARLAKNDFTQVNKIIDTFAKYESNSS